MGFKTNNYEVKKLGIVLPEAYAIIKRLNVIGESGYAEFAIQSTRGNSLNLQPIELVRIDFKVDRNESPYITAYKQAKGQREGFRYNEKSHKEEPVIINEHFHDWNDDIQ